jgi:hypothetical protein
MPIVRSSKASSDKSEGSKSKKIVSIEKKKFGGVRICQWCYKTKPDRCHHCS